MKKTVTVNLNGRVFTMDEDAYHLLDNYLRNIRIYFRKEEGHSEIIADFEARIEELFSEKLRLGYEVITITEVEEVISRVGRPDDFGDEQPAAEEPEKQSRREEFREVKKKFFRNDEDKMFGGVCSGIGAYFGWDVLAVRIIAVILLFASQFILAPLYLIAWLIFPAAKTAEEKLQMRGKPITVENIGKTVAAEAEQREVSSAGNRGCLAGFLDFIVGLMKVFLVGLGCLVGLPLIFALFIIIVVLFSVIFGVGGGLLSLPFAFFGGDTSFLTVDHPMLATVTFVILLAIPLIALIYTIISYFAKLRPVHSAVKWVCIIVWIIALVIFLFSGFKIDRSKLNDPFAWHWNYSDYSEETAVIGNGNITEAEYVLAGPVNSLHIGKYLWANMQIEQINGDSTYITINGDENLVDKVKYQLTEDRLYLSTHNDVRLSSGNNLIIRVRTPELKVVEGRTIGNISIQNLYKSEELNVKMEGAGLFQADSLQVGHLIVRSEGIGSTIVSGTARVADFRLEGAGNVDAYELRADSVKANVEGIGAIKCDPVKYFKGEVNGIGKITYKSEPEEKQSTLQGMGKIGLE